MGCTGWSDKSSLHLCLMMALTPHSSRDHHIAWTQHPKGHEPTTAMHLNEHRTTAAMASLWTWHQELLGTSIQDCKSIN